MTTGATIVPPTEARSTRLSPFSLRPRLTTRLFLCAEKIVTMAGGGVLWSVPLPEALTRVLLVMSQPEMEVSLLLDRIRDGDESAKAQLFTELQSELRVMASGLMRRERVDHTLQATALVNEACLKLLGDDAIDRMGDRRYLFASANRAMRQILVDHARSRSATKRGGEMARQSLDVVLDNFESSNGCRFEDLEVALDKLGEQSTRRREIVELRFFSGLSVPEVADVLEISVSSVERDWRVARAQLFQMLRDQESEEESP